MSATPEVAHLVAYDREQPRLDPSLAVEAAERGEEAEHRVLGHIHRIVPIAQHLEREQVSRLSIPLGQGLPGVEVSGPGQVHKLAVCVGGGARVPCLRLTFGHAFVHYPLLRHGATDYSR